MVRHGKDKKRRAGRYGKTKLKNKNFRRWNPNPKITDPTVKKLWDPSKSPSVNLANMGLVAKPNDALVSSDKDNHKNNNPIKAVELFDIPQSDDLSGRTKRIVPLSEDDQIYISKCMNKYGDDYKRMFMDIKLNDMQYTEGQLRKMGSRFLLLDKEQRMVEVPEKISHMMLVSS